MKAPVGRNADSHDRFIENPVEPFGVLALTHDIVRKKEGDNDGVVSVESAKFGERRENWNPLEIWPGNHFRQINWGTNILLTPSEENDETIVEKYTALAARLRNLPPQRGRCRLITLFRQIDPRHYLLGPAKARSLWTFRRSGSKSGFSFDMSLSRFLSRLQTQCI